MHWQQKIVNSVEDNLSSLCECITRIELGLSLHSKWEKKTVRKLDRMVESLYYANMQLVGGYYTQKK